MIAPVDITVACLLLPGSSEAAAAPVPLVGGGGKLRKWMTVKNPSEKKESLKSVRSLKKVWKAIHNF